MQRKANALWRGSIQQGQGVVSNASGALKEVPYTFAMRFTDAPGTNPEELIAAAHASCFAMAVSGGLTSQGLEPLKLDTQATVTLQKDGTGWRVNSSHLELKAQVNDVTQGQFLEIVEDAKKNCPISKLLNAEITLDARLEQSDERPWAPPPAY